MLALSLDPENAEAMEEMKKLNGLIAHCGPGDGGVGAASSSNQHQHQHQHQEAEAAPAEEDGYVIQEMHDLPLDVVVVGAGASGVGVGIMLTKVFNLDPERVMLVERGSAVGETFRQWPKEMRFISPSFNQQGWTKSFDLNSVVYGTSPAFSLHAEHPTGEQ